MTTQTQAVALSAEALLEATKLLPSKSQQIRYLHATGMKTGDIAKMLTTIHYPKGEKNVRYQHVRNVLMMKVKGE